MINSHQGHAGNSPQTTAAHSQSPNNFITLIHFLQTLLMVQCTPTKKARIWTLHQNGVGVSEISRSLSLHRSTVHRTLKQLSINPDFYAKTPQSGRPRILNERDLRHAALLLARQEARNATDLQRKAFPQVAARTMRHNLAEIGLKGYVRRKKPYLSPMHRRKRKMWAEHKLEWGKEEWDRVVFSDESKFNLFGSDGRQYCRRRKGEELLERNVQKVVKYGGGNVMVWGCITANGPGRLHRVEGKMDAKQYCDILTESLLGTLQDYGLSHRDIIFQQDNDPKHTSKLAQGWFWKNGMAVMTWPPNSPDMNILEHVWNYIDSRLRARKKQPSNLEELWVALQEEWANLDKEYIRRLYDSLPTRVAALKQAKGSYTKY